jgi:subtilisin family serine protease
MNPLDLVTLTPLMARTTGRPDLRIGLIDGPVALDHPGLAQAHRRELPAPGAGICAQASSAACLHGTFVAGILCATRGSAAPAICPDCTLLVRPIFAETREGSAAMPSAAPEDLARAICDCLQAGAHVLTLSLALLRSSPGGERTVGEALDQAARQGVLAVAAAGNQGSLGGSVITRHPGVIPVVAYERSGGPMGQSNLGRSMGRRGLGAPGDAITSLGARGGVRTFGGTSAATPFVTGAIALLWSAFPAATAAQIRWAITQASAPRRTTVVPPLLDAWAAYQAMVNTYARRSGP